MRRAPSGPTTPRPRMTMSLCRACPAPPARWASWACPTPWRTPTR
ncbi:hypothetical protein ACFFX0_32400 [Citricoccus parietis]|uniref:Uncharacterized protein n=1 Tax=Citricoccus parietis TaxID=592307 RepID=A0ABV5G9I1_9MICC